MVRILSEIAASALIVMALSGCGTPYVVPTSGPTAKLRFTATERVPPVNLFTWASEKCDKQQNIGDIAGYLLPIHAALGKTLKPEDAYHDTVVRADGPIVIGTTFYYRNAVCGVTTVFEPEAGAQYEAAVDSREPYCTLEMFKLTTDAAGKPVRVLDKTARRAKKDCG